MTTSDENRTTPSAEFVRDLLSADGRRRPGDENLTGLADALRALSPDLQMDVAAALYTYAADRLDVAENAETQSRFMAADDFRAANLARAERLARLWREACYGR